MNAKEWLGSDNKLGYDIWNNKYRYNNESFNDWLDRVSGGNAKIRELILNKKFLFAGRTLANRGIPDSGSFSNCYTSGYVKDSLKDIMAVNTKLALTYQSQGGQGLSLTKLRPKGSTIKDRFTSDGIIPFMEIFNTTTESISQSGSRKGALMMSLDIEHKQAEEFITIKENKNKINKANLSLEISDEFMQFVTDNFDNDDACYAVTKEYGTDRIQTITYDVFAVRLFKLLCKSAWKSAEPGVLFTERLRNYNMMEFIGSYNIETTNPCFRGDMQILTSDGYKPLYSLENENCELINMNGEAVDAKVSFSGMKPVYEIAFTNHKSIFCTANHKFLTNDNEETEAKDLVGKSVYAIGKSRTFEVKSVEFIGEDAVYDFTLYDDTHWGVIEGMIAHNCGEQPMAPDSACGLSSVNLSEYIDYPYTKDALFDFYSFKRDLHYVVEAMDDVLEENIPRHPMKEQRDVATKFRNIGVGIMGVADMFVKMGITYGSYDSVTILDSIMLQMILTSINASADLAEKRGAFPGYEDAMYDSKFLKQFSLERKPLRNCSLLSIAPTGSIGTMLNVSTGIEPYFSLSYKRKTESLQNGKEAYYDVYVPTLEEYRKVNPYSISELPPYFVSSYQIDPMDRVHLQAEVQEYVDTAISSTINLPKDATVEDIEKIYMEAWKCGLKGVTVYRDGSRDPILSVGKQTKRETWIKRPDVLEADYYQIISRGESFIVVVGLYEDKPYEIFAYKNISCLDLKKHKGTITKVMKGVYKFESELLTIENLISENENDLQKACTLYTSHLLRSEMDIPFIIKTTKKINMNITSFASAMCYILSNYCTLEGVCPECGGKLVYEISCCKCPTCGYSKCG